MVYMPALTNPGSHRGDSAPPSGTSSLARTARELAAEWPFSVVFGTATAAVIVIAFGVLQHGLALLGAALLLGSILRFILSPARAGLLAVRRRGTDVVTMALLGAIMLVLSVVPYNGP
jgi:hypothetical protein